MKSHRDGGIGGEMVTQEMQAWVWNSVEQLHAKDLRPPASAAQKVVEDTECHFVPQDPESDLQGSAITLHAMWLN